MLNIEPIDRKPYILNIVESGDRHTIELFLRLFEVMIHNLRIDNDASDSKEYFSGAINELLRLYNIFKIKPEKKKEE